MKKTLFLLAAAATCTACSMDETTEVDQGLPIDFRTAVATRATAIENGDINQEGKSILVTAIDSKGADYFTDVTFTREADSYFKSTEKYYWPSDGLTFYASAPNPLGSGGTVNISSSGKTVKYTPDKDISKQVDFIAVKTDLLHKSDGVSAAALDFKHKLSQIEIRAKNTSTTKFTMNVKDSGTFDFDTDKWSTEEGSETTYPSDSELATYSETPLTDDDVSLMKTDGDNAMLIPQLLRAWNPSSDERNDEKGAYLAVNIQIVENDGASGPEQLYPAGEDEYGWAAMPLSGEWQAGYKYTYTLDFSKGAGYVDPEDEEHPGEKILGDPIKFTVTVSDSWETHTEEPSVDLGE